MYILSILGYLSWPFLIAVSYLSVRWALNYYERKHLGQSGETQEG